MNGYGNFIPAISNRCSEGNILKRFPFRVLRNNEMLTKILVLPLVGSVLTLTALAASYGDDADHATVRVLKQMKADKSGGLYPGVVEMGIEFLGRQRR